MDEEQKSEEINTPNKKGHMSEKTRNIVEWVICIVIAIVLTLLFRYFIATPTVVKQVSMYPTLVQDQRLIVKRTFRITGNMPKRGDIITFEAPTHTYSSGTADQSNPVAIYMEDDRNLIENFVYNVLEITKKSYIKRVIGLPGEHIEIKDGNVYINGKLQEEEYLSDDIITESEIFTDFIVPDDYLFCMGDNRGKSTDCRSFGCIPYDKIEGIVVCRFWPLNKIGTVK
ncbi:MAG: signal peptidase I [Clostridia bacterium]|nr:signal peptidase I [Clostridia bacterium]